MFDIFFKRLYEESSEDLQINRRPFKVFVKLDKSPLLIANLFKDAVSGLRQFLAIESP